MTAALAAGSRHLSAPRTLAHLVDVQDAVLTRKQLARAGIDQDQIRGNLAARRWQRIGRPVVVLHNAPLNATQRRWAAVLQLEQPAALAGITAAVAAGLEDFDEPTVVHIVVRRACNAQLPSWVKLHNSRRFSAADIHPGAATPRTRTARSLIDAAAWSANPRRACAILCAGVQQRLVRADMLAAELRTAGSVRHAKILRSVLGDIAGGGHTLGEIQLAPLLRRAGLPAPRRQVLRRERGGRVRYLDAVVELPDGTELAIEIDGAVHLKPLHWWDDMDRQNEIAIAGQPMLRFDSVLIRLDKDLVLDRLRRMALAHGG